MREIIFRGKMLNAEKWLYGNLQVPSKEGVPYYMWDENLYQRKVDVKTIGLVDIYRISFLKIHLFRYIRIGIYFLPYLISPPRLFIFALYQSIIFCTTTFSTFFDIGNLGPGTKLRNLGPGTFLHFYIFVIKYSNFNNYMLQ